MNEQVNISVVLRTQRGERKYEDKTDNNGNAEEGDDLIQIGDQRTHDRGETDDVNLDLWGGVWL